MSMLETVVLVISGLSATFGLLTKLKADPAIRRLLKRIKLPQVLLVDAAAAAIVAILASLVHEAVVRYLDRTLAPGSPVLLLNQDAQLVTLALAIVLIIAIVVLQIILIRHTPDDVPQEKPSPSV